MSRGEGRDPELIGQQAETRNVGGPAQARGDEVPEGDLERVARLRALDIDRAGDRIDPAEIERRDVDGSRALLELAVGGVEAFEVNGLSRLARQRRREVAVPAEIMVLAVDRMIADGAHLKSSSSHRELLP